MELAGACALSQFSDRWGKRGTTQIYMGTPKNFPALCAHSNVTPSYQRLLVYRWSYVVFLEQFES